MIVGLALGVLVPVALATTTNYFGYANLTASNPPANSCGSPSVAGLACSGWSNWDDSEGDWISGHSGWVLGFVCQSDGLLWGYTFSGYEAFGTYSTHYSTYCPGHYNRVAVYHFANGNGTYNYLQGRAIK